MKKQYNKILECRVYFNFPMKLYEVAGNKFSIPISSSRSLITFKLYHILYKIKWCKNINVCFG